MRKYDLLNYLYEVQLALAVLPDDTADDILHSLESQLLDEIDAKVTSGLPLHLAERAVIDAKMPPRKIAHEYVLAHEQRRALDFVLPAGVAYLLAAVAIISILQDRSTLGVAICAGAICLVLLQTLIEMVPYRATSVLRILAPIGSAVAVLVGIGAAAMLALDAVNGHISIGLANGHANLAVTLRNIPLPDIGHALTILLSTACFRSTASFTQMQRKLRNPRYLHERASRWRGTRLSWRTPEEPFENVDAVWQNGRAYVTRIRIGRRYR